MKTITVSITIPDEHEDIIPHLEGKELLILDKAGCSKHGFMTVLFKQNHDRTVKDLGELACVADQYYSLLHSLNEITNQIIRRDEDV